MNSYERSLNRSASSLVVIEISQSGTPSVINYGRWASRDLAVHGIIPTTQISEAPKPIVLTQCFLMVEQIIPCGDLPVDTLGISSGYFISIKLTHAGQQLVRQGVYLDSIFYITSPASSIVHASAPH